MNLIKKLRLMKSRAQAFTLLELLVTVAIVGILATIAVQLFQEYRRKSYDMIALSEMQNAMLAMHAYESSNLEGRCGFTLHATNTLDNPQYGVPSDSARDCLPGFVHDPRVIIAVANNTDPPTYQTKYFQATHCDGSSDEQGRDIVFMYTTAIAVPFNHYEKGRIITVSNAGDLAFPTRASECPGASEVPEGGGGDTGAGSDTGADSGGDTGSDTGSDTGADTGSDTAGGGECDTNPGGCRCGDGIILAPPGYSTNPYSPPSNVNEICNSLCAENGGGSYEGSCSPSGEGGSSGGSSGGGSGDSGYDSVYDPCAHYTGIDQYGIVDGECCSMARCADDTIIGVGCGDPAYEFSCGGGDSGAGSDSGGYGDSGFGGDSGSGSDSGFGGDSGSGSDSGFGGDSGSGSDSGGEPESCDSIVVYDYYFMQDGQCCSGSLCNNGYVTPGGGCGYPLETCGG